MTASGSRVSVRGRRGQAAPGQDRSVLLFPQRLFKVFQRPTQDFDPTDGLPSSLSQREVSESTATQSGRNQCTQLVRSPWSSVSSRPPFR
jgi:hypothetical protein